MKRLVLMIISAFICGALLTNCKKAEQKSSFVITDDDIISFNVTTGEIVLTDSKADEIVSLASHYSEYPELQIFIKGKKVFVPKIPISHFSGDLFCCTPCPWESMNDLGLFVFLNSNTFLLIEGYLPWQFLSDNEKDRESILQKQEENSKRRNKELKVLIGYLDTTGKIVE